MGDPDNRETDFIHASMKFGAWWNALLCGWWLQNFIALCYRFDYTQSHLSTPVDDEGPEASMKEDIVLSDGFLALYGSQKFSKPYYSAAIASWFVANALVLYLYTVEVIRLPIGDTDDYGFAAIVTFTAMPLMLLAILVLAIVRGELGILKAYQEDWTLKPQDSSLSERC